jgi:ABC-type sulfate transport system permease component
MELSGEYCADCHGSWNVSWDAVFDERYLSSVSVCLLLFTLYATLFSLCSCHVLGYGLLVSCDAPVQFLQAAGARDSSLGRK